MYRTFQMFCVGSVRSEGSSLRPVGKMRVRESVGMGLCT